MEKLLNETLDLLKQTHFSLLNAETRLGEATNFELNKKIKAQILKIKRNNNRKVTIMEKIDKLFVAGRNFARIRENFLKLSSVHQRTEMAHLKLTADKFLNAVTDFLEDLNITGDNTTEMEEKALNVLQDIVESKLAGMIHEKFERCVSNEVDKIYGTIEASLLEKFHNEAFLEKVKEKCRVDFQTVVEKRPEEFQPGTVVDPVEIDAILDSTDTQTNKKKSGRKRK